MKFRMKEKEFSLKTSKMNLPAANPRSFKTLNVATGQETKNRDVTEKHDITRRCFCVGRETETQSVPFLKHRSQEKHVAHEHGYRDSSGKGAGLSQT